ncbi:hypothetical protein [uncultured Metabacillus sp.]|uniref:MotE family protein n=1 Tax=uncultured Metabacillus sp. TaxID=2860135 RepID=UPI00261510D5|nr:hypothetical protein [uncultured Metabacillus sp.]
MESEKKEYGKFQWFFFVIFIPFIFTVVLLGIIFSVAGFDVLGKTKEVLTEASLVENLFNKKGEDLVVNEKTGKEQDEQQKEESEKLQNTLEEQTAMIDALEKDVSVKEKEIQKLNQEIKSLQTQIESLNSAETKENTVDLAKLYENMSSKKAAEIIPKLNNDEALFILTSLDDTQIADILAKMTVDDAVKFTNLLAENSE